MTKKNNEELVEDTTLEDAGRRKAVKTIVGGVTALAAYNVLPVKWGSPIIEQVFLPAHAATSGTSLNDPCSVERFSLAGVRVTGFVTPATGGLTTTIVATPFDGAGDAGVAVTETITTAADGTFTADISVIGPGVTRVDVLTTVEGADGSARCSVNVGGDELA